MEEVKSVVTHSMWSDFDIYLFKQGRHFNLHELFGSHKIEVNGVSGYYFSVYAPGARSVSVIGNFNYWDPQSHPLHVRWDSSGIWEGFIPGLADQELYKYAIQSNHVERLLEKTDPYAKHYETPPRTASITWPIQYKWKDKKWLSNRSKVQSFHKPLSVYEVHLGSWKRKEGNDYLTYRDMAEELVPYVKDMGFTHVEFLPVMEHPYDLSWGYQVTGYFAPTSRFGTPQDFKYLVDCFHQAGIGVILDWVPSHFPEDDFGIARFDGSNVYEHPDARKGFHPDWKSLIFNYERPEIVAFLISSAMFWIDEYHIDGLRVDAVASMLYLDYSREEGEWEANEFGGNYNLAAIEFIKQLNHALYEKHPDIHMIAEESTSFDGVTKPVHEGGLGFGLKWMMGWMNDTLDYFSKDPIYRSHHQGEITFSMIYAFTENFMLPLSHDEVVHGKQSLIYKMPGDEWQRFANLRVLYGYMYAHPGAKLLFMGSEFGQTSEWNSRYSLDWHLKQYTSHQGISRLIKKLNLLLNNEPGLYYYNYEPKGFDWIDLADNRNSIISFQRNGAKPKDAIVVVCNFTPTPHRNYGIGVPVSGTWEVLLNTDDTEYGGSGFSAEYNHYETVKAESHGHKQSLSLFIPPLSVLILKIVKVK